MASLEQRNGIYRVVFRFAGGKYSRSLKTRDQRAAAAALARLEDNLRRVEFGTLAPPPDADIAQFLLSDGRLNGRPKSPQVRSLGGLFDAFFSSLPGTSIEESTLYGMQIHVRHWKRILGVSFRLHSLGHTDLQQYIEKRSKEKGLRGKTVSATTIRKEVVTLTTIWRWAKEVEIVDRDLPKRGLRFPKTTEKPPFQTWREIERKIGRGGLTKHEQADLWDSLFLTLPEIVELLDFIQGRARHGFIAPMFTFAAHTGARRSEMLRSQIDDIDFAANMVTIREKKRVRGKLTTRSVPLSPVLADVLKVWLTRHPGGNFTFCHELAIERSKKQRTECGGLTRDEAHDHFKRTLAGSKWEKLRGWHVFRHSFCSNCAAAGIDQRIINGWVGHQTEEMVRRYRHLIPSQQQDAIRHVFGGNASAISLTRTA